MEGCVRYRQSLDVQAPARAAFDGAVRRRRAVTALTMQPLPDRHCPLCGAPNECAPACDGTFDVPCWCTAITVSAAALDLVPPDKRERACLCVRCATSDARTP